MGSIPIYEFKVPCIIRETNSKLFISAILLTTALGYSLSREIKSPKTQTANFHNDQTFNLTYVIMCLEILEIKSKWRKVQWNL